MVTVLRDGGFRVVIYLNDHAPAHVHAVKGSGEAKIDIVADVRLISAVALTKAEVRRAVGIVAENQEFLLAKWNEIHG